MTSAVMAGIPCALLLGFALPPALRERSWKRFFIAAALSVAGILLPLFIFVFSICLTPEWKGGCDHGWIDCFHLGKLALAPLVLWASAALYVTDIYRGALPLKPWISLGLFQGAVVSSICFLFGVATAGLTERFLRGWLLVPFYTAVWYWARTVQLTRAGNQLGAYAKALCGSLPFWIGSLLWSRSYYASLPENPPSCFVVTAASRGHREFVGPFVEVAHRGRKRPANHQLMTLWQFEALWCTRAPASHAAFRRAYNRFGPAMAQQITSPWLADAAYLALLPAELLAGLAIRLFATDRSK
jgi:hypothetical protein